MKKIHGIEIDESKDLGYNLRLLRESMLHRLSFWGQYEKGLRAIAKYMKVAKVHFLIRSVYFILLLPRFILYLFSRKQIDTKIHAAEDELVRHYKRPDTKVRQFRLECIQEKAFYQNEINQIDQEISMLRERLEMQSVTNSMHSEILELISAYEINRKAKQIKSDFYHSCEQRLAAIEEQIQLQGTLQDSKRKLLTLQDDESDSTRLTEIKKEFELYDYYGDLLEDISSNLKKVNEDKEEKLQEHELQKMLNQIRHT
jgi:hypothetical protein